MVAVRPFLRARSFSRTCFCGATMRTRACRRLIASMSAPSDAARAVQHVCGVDLALPAPRDDPRRRPAVRAALQRHRGQRLLRARAGLHRPVQHDHCELAEHGIQQHAGLLGGRELAEVGAYAASWQPRSRGGDLRQALSCSLREDLPMGTPDSLHMLSSVIDHCCLESWQITASARKCRLRMLTTTCTIRTRKSSENSAHLSRNTNLASSASCEARSRSRRLCLTPHVEATSRT